MIFSPPLIKGTLIKRYKRFLADIHLDTGEFITAHCANSGAMLGITEPGSRVWVSHEPSPTRKLSYSWHLVEADGTIIGMNTSWPNVLAQEAILAGKVPSLSGYTSLRREVKYGSSSRIDILLEDPQKGLCFVEVKNVHLKQGKQALFPDSVTQRGAKHLRDLKEEVVRGNRGVMLYIVQRNDCETFGLADHIDPTYAATARDAFAHGVEAYAYACHLTPEGIILTTPLSLHGC